MLKIATRLMEVADLSEIVELLVATPPELQQWRGGELFWQEKTTPISQIKSNNPSNQTKSSDREKLSNSSNSASLTEQLHKCLTNPDFHCVVGTVDEIAVGMGIVSAPGSVACVNGIYVAKDARGVGVGESIMAELLRWASEQGSGGVDADVLPGDRLTKNFFESHAMSARKLTLFREIPQHSDS